MSEIDQIKQSISIYDVVGKYVELKKSGINYSGRCPFHNEKTPSFYVSPDRGTFKCFGCGEGGDIFTFYEKIEGMEFKEVLHKLAAEAGVTLSKNSGQKSATSKGERDNNLAILQWAVVFWQKQLSASPEAIDYLKKRGFTKQMVIDYALGYAPNQWESLKQFLLSKNIPEKDIEKVGLIKTGDKGKSYDRFRDRIIFPLRNVSGKTVAFSGRYIGSDDVSAKYLNSPETPVFNKSKELYGLDTAKHAMRKNNFAIVVEGQVDLVMSQSVFPNTVATSGTSLTAQHLQSIKRFTDRVIFVFDNDNAGVNASHKASILALGMDFEVRIATLPSGQDPADIIIKDVDAYKQYIKKAEDVFDYWIAVIANPNVKPREKTQLLEDRVFPLLHNHANALEQDRYINQISEKLQLSVSAIRTQLQSDKHKTSIASQYSDTKEDAESEPKTLTPFSKIALLLYWQEQVSVESRFIDPESIIKQFQADEQNELRVKISSHSEDSEIEEKMFDLEKMYENSIILENDINELLVNMSSYKSKQHQNTLMQQHALAIAQGETEKAQQLLQQINETITHAGKKNSNKEDSKSNS